eukprot:gb/GECH01011245.1/.p1 GENE.gb/GECH01011245.1/~~gb/GECH01011245.1/.p1  ORF type:complete len:155 (+),score=50.34 gb/GECH01011245.1/:1-465(+)
MVDQAKIASMKKAVRTGGKGSMRRVAKKRATAKGPSPDDRKIQTALKKLGLNPIPGIEEVNMFMNDSSIMQFKHPKVQTAFQANTHVVSGKPQHKDLKEVLPDVMNQLGSDNVSQLQQLADTLKQQMAKKDEEKEEGKEGEKKEDLPEVETFES